jgi:hypothetical protein
MPSSRASGRRLADTPRVHLVHAREVTEIDEHTSARLLERGPHGDLRRRQIADRLEREGQGQALGQRSEHRRRRLLRAELCEKMACERVIHDGHGHARILPGVVPAPLGAHAIPRQAVVANGQRFRNEQGDGPRGTPTV